MIKSEKFDKDVWDKIVFYLMTYYERQIFKIAVEHFGEENVDASYLYKAQKAFYINMLIGLTDETLRGNLVYGRGESRKNYNICHLPLSNKIAYDYVKEVHDCENRKELIPLLQSYCCAFEKFRESYVPENIEHGNIREIHNYESDMHSGFVETKLFIHIPKATVILNENTSRRHEIYDVYWSVGSCGGCLADYNVTSQKNQIGLAMLRTTFSKDEFFPNGEIYCHSHCMGSHTFGLTGSPFCVGNGPIRLVVKKMRDYVLENRNIDKYLVELFFSELLTITGVESNEGGQYYHISHLFKDVSKELFNPNITKNISIDRNRGVGLSVYKNIFEYSKKFKMFKYSIIKNKISFSNSTKDLILRLSSLIRRFINCDSVEAVIDERNNIYIVSGDVERQNESLYRSLDNLSFVFKNKEIKVKIKSLSESNTFKIYPYAADYSEVSQGILEMALKFIFQNKKRNKLIKEKNDKK